MRTQLTDFNLDTNEYVHIKHIVHPSRLLSLGDAYFGVALVKQKRDGALDRSASPEYQVVGYIKYSKCGSHVRAMELTGGIPGEKMSVYTGTVEICHRQTATGAVIVTDTPYVYDWVKTKDDEEAVDRALAHIRMTVEEFPRRMNRTPALTWSILDEWAADYLGIQKSDWIAPTPPKIHTPAPDNRERVVSSGITAVRTGDKIETLYTMNVRIGAIIDGVVHLIDRDFGDRARRAINKYRSTLGDCALVTPDDLTRLLAV